MLSAALPVWLPWFLCSIHTFLYLGVPQAAASRVCSLWSCGVLCWGWHAIISLTGTYFPFGISHASCTSLEMQVHTEGSLKVNGEYWCCLHQCLCFGAQVQMEKIKIESPDIQIRSWLSFSSSFLWQLWLQEMFMEAACVLLAIDVRTRKTVPAAPPKDLTLTLLFCLSVGLLERKLWLFSVFLLLMTESWGLLL